MGEPGCAALAQVFDELPRLRKVALDRCDIGDKGLAPLAKVFKQMVFLSHVSLQGNCIGDAGAAVLGSALGGSSGLDFVDLRKNKISNAASKAFASALCPERGFRCSVDVLDGPHDGYMYISAAEFDMPEMKAQLMSDTPLLNLFDYQDPYFKR